MSNKSPLHTFFLVCTNKNEKENTEQTIHGNGFMDSLLIYSHFSMQSYK